jgi:VanZ family protein
MAYYIIISGITMGIWYSYNQYTTSGISILDIILNMIGFLLIGWVMLPISILALLDSIKIRK